MLEKQYFKVN